MARALISNPAGRGINQSSTESQQRLMKSIFVSINTIIVFIDNMQFQYSSSVTLKLESWLGYCGEEAKSITNTDIMFNVHARHGGDT